MHVIDCLVTYLELWVSLSWLAVLVVEASGSAVSTDVSRGFTDAVDTEPLGVASADKPKASIPKSSSLDIPVAAAGSSSLKTSSDFTKV